MKLILSLILLIILTGCNVQHPNNSLVTINQSREDIKDIEGVWGLSTYLDTILAKKEIAKYSFQDPALFCILLNIDTDTINSFGSIHRSTGILNNKSDTLFEYTMTESGKWHLIKNNKTLLLKQQPSEHHRNSKTYFLKKRDDLEYMTILPEKINKRRYYFEEHINQYFIENIIEGNYTWEYNNGNVNFLNDGTIYGLDDYTNYTLIDYFGTYHPFRKLDAICLINQNSKEQDYFNWTLQDDKMTFKMLIRDRNSESFDLTDYTLNFYKSPD